MMVVVQNFYTVRCEIDHLSRLRQLHLNFRRVVPIQHGSRNQISSERVSATGDEERKIPPNEGYSLEVIPKSLGQHVKIINGMSSNQ